MTHTLTAVIEVTEGWDVPQVRAALADLVRATREEPGCILFDIRQSRDAPHRFTLWEVWTSEEALKDHFTYAHTKAVIEPGMTHVVSLDVQTDIAAAGA